MSGAGRKHRAKHLTSQYLDVNAWEGLKEKETLAVCTESPHGQHVRVLLLAPLLGTATSEGAFPAAEVEFPQEALIHLPRKFHKVIWLSIKDVVVVAADCVQLKPSPEQLEIFLKNPTNAAWRDRIVHAQSIAIERRRAMERMPLHNNLTTTTTRALPEARNTGDEEPTLEKGFTAENMRKIKLGDSDDFEGNDTGSDRESLSNIVNPNRRTIKHREQFFYASESDEELDKEEDSAF